MEEDHSNAVSNAVVTAGGGENDDDDNDNDNENDKEDSEEEEISNNRVDSHQSEFNRYVLI